MSMLMQNFREKIYNLSITKLMSYYSIFLGIVVCISYIIYPYTSYTHLDIKHKHIKQETSLFYESIRSGNYIRFIYDGVNYGDLCDRLTPNLCNQLSGAKLIEAKYIVIQNHCKAPMVKNAKYHSKCLIAFTEAKFKLASGEKIHYHLQEDQINTLTGKQPFPLGLFLPLYLWGLASIYIIKKPYKR